MTSLLAVLTVAIMPHLTSISAQPAPGCQTQCGDVEIPYPFGIGTDCAMGPGFELYCNKTADGHMKPFIINVEVLNISLLHGQTRAQYSVSTYCYNYSTRNSDQTLWWLDFTGWPPYRFSNTRNKFVLLGCNTLAYIYNSRNKTEYTSACASLCTSVEMLANGSSCDGIGCCQISNIPEGLSRYDVYFYTIYNDSESWRFNPCSYAALVETESFSFNTEYITTTRFNDTYNGQQPLVLDWRIGNVSCEVAQKMTSYACHSGNSFCVDSKNGPGYLCNCTNGYQGNPYLRDGCTDFNECEQNPSPCPKGSTCHNTIGAYYCSCPPFKELANDGNSCRQKINLILGVATGLGCGFGVLALTLISVALVRRWKRYAQKKIRRVYFQRNQGLLLEQLISSDESVAHNTRIFSMQELEKASDNFDSTRIVGHGGHGTVYKGILTDQRVVAIKKSKIVEQHEIDQFVNEVAILSQVIHRNVVKLYGCCLESEVPLLVYEFISNGTLYGLLHGDPSNICLLTWADRIRIAFEAASALAYLHSATTVPIFHRDVKSCNILLDENFITKVSDFGASRSVPIGQTHVVTAVQGTFGYLDPEYYHTGQLNDKSDVYSFGVILVELLTRKKPIFAHSSGEKQNLSQYFLYRLQNKTTVEIVDVQILEEAGRREIDDMVSLASDCLRLRREERPTMKEVELRLQLLRGKIAKKNKDEILEDNETEPLLLYPSNSTSQTLVEVGRVANLITGGATRCYTMEQELVSWTDLPR